MRLPGLAAGAAAALASLLASAPAFAQGCPMCKQALEESSPRAIEGFYYSILLLVSLPVLMAGTFTFLLWRAGRKRREREAGEPVSPAA